MLTINFALGGHVYWAPNKETGVCPDAIKQLFKLTELPISFDLLVTKRYRNSTGWRKVEVSWWGGNDAANVSWWQGGALLVTSQCDFLVKHGMLQHGEGATLWVKMVSPEDKKA